MRTLCALEWEGDDTVLVAGSMTIDDFNEMVGTQLLRIKRLRVTLTPRPGPS